MTTIRLPGLIDAHVHLREPGYSYKEDFYTGTVAALAGGVTALLDMPNTQPPTSTPERFHEKVQLAAEKAVCDVGLFVGSTSTELDAYLPVAQHACGLKIYVSETFGSLRIEELDLMHRFFRTWAERADALGGYRTAENPGGLGPIAVHAEDLMAAVCINLSHLYNVPLHIVHVSRRSEIELIRRAKEQDVPVTCEATPHHLFLSTEDLPRLGARGDMRPRIASPDDMASLWENLDVIDIFATDHAPHTSTEKGFGNAGSDAQEDVTHPPGIPGLETMLPLLLTAVHADRLTVDDIVERCVTAPRRIYGVPEQPDTYIEVDVDAQYTLHDADVRSKVGWTTFDGETVFGRVEKVVLRDKTVFENGQLLADKGSGQVLFI